jgi:hypothetical protein
LTLVDALAVRALDRPAEQRDIVGNALQCVVLDRRPREGRACGRRQRDEAAGEIAAVDGRHVPRLERAQRRRLDPVEEVTAMPRQLRERPEDGFDTLADFRQPDPAELVRSDGRHDVHADVGRRRPMRDDAVRIHLQVVRRQEMVFGSREVREVLPRLPCDQPQLGGLFRRR